MAESIYKEQQLGMEERRTRATEYRASQAGQPSYQLEKPIITGPDGRSYESEIPMPYNPKTGRFFDAAKGKEILDINEWGLGEPSHVDGEAMPTPTSQNDIIAPSTAYSFGKAVGGPDELQDKWTNKGYTSTGPNLVEGVVAVNTNKYPLGTIFKDSESGKVYVAADRHGNKDSGVIDFFQNPENYTGGKTNKRLSIIGSIPKNKIPKTKEGMSQLIEQYSNVPDYSTSSNASQIDGALSMGGDMSQQAMGTPDQQAEVARMIEEGSGMATSQAAPSGAMPTEPRMAQPQPTQQAPQYKVRPGFVPVGSRQQQNTVKVVTGEEAQNYKLPPSGTYEISLNPDGSLAGTEKIIPPISEDQLKKETKIEQEQALRSVTDAAEGIRIVNKLTESSGFAGVFGAGIGLKYLPSTEARTAENYRKKLVALATTDTMRKFQGLGQMSDKEFGVAQDSATMLSDPGISEEAAASELNRLRSYFATSIRRAEELGRVPKGTAQKLIEQSMSAAGAQGSQSNQAESDASFIQGFQSGE
jgi:hypothetical protein